MLTRRHLVLATAGVGLLAATRALADLPPLAKKDSYKVGFAQTESNNPWRLAQTASMHDEAKKLGNQLVYTDAAGSAAKQVADVNSMIAQKVDLIFLPPREEKPLIPALKAAKKAGIPVILIDRNVDQSLAKPGEDYVTFIGSDFVEEGKRVAEWLIKTVNGKAKIIELEGTLGCSPANDRKKGFDDYIKNHRRHGDPGHASRATSPATRAARSPRRCCRLIPTRPRSTPTMTRWRSARSRPRGGRQGAGQGHHRGRDRRREGGAAGDHRRQDGRHLRVQPALRAKRLRDDGAAMPRARRCRRSSRTRTASSTPATPRKTSTTRLLSPDRRPRPAACRSRLPVLSSGALDERDHPAADPCAAIDKRFSRRAGADAAPRSRSAPGEVHALVGQNGAGKSTLIKILTGAYRKDGGEVEFDGRPIEFASPQAAQRGGISTIYQEINLVPLRSVAENIFLGREPRRFGFLDWRADERRGDAPAAPVPDRRSTSAARCWTSTPPIQQMVAIARAVSFERKLVIMDEPTSSLDEREVGGAVRRDPRSSRRDGVSVVFVSHQLDELYAVCDRVTVMRDGRTVLVGRDGRHRQARAGGRHARPRSRAGRARGRHRLPQAGSSRRRRAARGRASGGRPTGARRQPRGARAARSWAWPACSGSGRTEVARASSAPIAPMAARSRSTASRPRSRSPPTRSRAGLGFCSEDRKVEGIVPDMSVRENLTLALLPRLARRRHRRRGAAARDGRALHPAAGHQAAPSPEQRIRELSGGNQQKVLLARWLCMNPRLLILDEPTRGIDVGGKAEIQTLIKELADQGLGVLMISSELEEIVEGCDRVFVLRDGRTVAELSHAELSELAVMTAMAHGDGARRACRWLRRQPPGPAGASAPRRRCPAVALRHARGARRCSCCSISPSRRTSPPGRR